MKQAVKDFPEEINEIYKQMIDRILSRDRGLSRLARRVLSWISHAQRPLRLGKLQSALAVKPETFCLDEDDKIPESLLLDSCLGLVVLEKETAIVHLVHYSAQEYLDKRLHDYFPSGHVDIGETCLTYLSFKDQYRNLVYEIAGDLRWGPRTLKESLLSGYAAQHWAFHVRKAED